MLGSLVFPFADASTVGLAVRPDVAVKVGDVVDSAGVGDKDTTVEGVDSPAGAVVELAEVGSREDLSVGAGVGKGVDG